MQVGYIGLGVMGSALARRLSLSRPLHVFDLNANALTSLVGAGARAASSPAALAAESDTVMLCLPRSSDVRIALFGEDGVVRGLKPGAIIIDQTSGDPGETRKMAAELSNHDIHLIDAPVSGGAQGAEAGTIAIMVGGDDEQVLRVRPILEEISPNIFHCGGVGSGQVMKLVNNTISASNRFVMLEAVAMGVRNGLDIHTMADVLNSGGARSRASESLLPAIARGEPDSFFLLSLMLKDLNLSTQLAIETGVPLQFGQLTRSMLQMALNAFGPEANYFDISKLVAAQAGIRFKSHPRGENS